MDAEVGPALISAVVFALLLIVPIWKIFAKAGLTPALSLLMFIPIAGGIIVIAILAFSRWPATESGLPDAAL